MLVSDMKKHFKKIIGFYILIFTLVLFFPNQTLAQTQTNTCANGQIQANGTCVNLPNTCANGQGLVNGKCTTVTNTDTTYTPLAPIPGTPFDGTTPFDTQGTCAFGNYLNIMIKLILGIAAVLSMVMITMGGIEYMTSELVSSKESGKNTITNAILGLVIALGAYVILNTINPQLLNACLDKLPMATITVDLGGESSQPFVPFTGTNKTRLNDDFGITLCNGTGGKAAVVPIGKQFIPQTEYSQDKRNTMSSSTIYVDCSSFVDQVYVCAGLPSPGNTTTEIFSSGNATHVDGKTYDFTQLNPGDLVGWKVGDNGSGAKTETSGHVAIYAGNGQILDTQDTNNPTAIRDLNSIKDRVTYVRWP
jgi:hypothetical protein